MKKFMVEVSARHVHLTQESVDILFGKGHELTVDKYLSQPGQFVCKEKVVVKGPKNTFPRVSIIGPVRKDDQFELSMTDCRTIGVNAVLRESGDVAGTPGVEVSTELGTVTMEQGVIVAKRHVHMTTADAKEYQVEDKQIVGVKVDSGTGRATTFEDVIVRVSDSYALAMHIDTDEANAAAVPMSGADGELVIL